MTTDDKYIFDNMDDVIERLSPYGLFQGVLNIILCVMIIPVTSQVMIMYFIAVTPPWRCAPNSTVCLSNQTFPANNNSRCSAMQRHDWLFTESRDFSIVTTFDIYCKDDWLIHLTTSTVFVGWILGAMICGWIGDNYGRRAILLLSSVLVNVLSILSTLSWNIYTFIAFRFLIGFFISPIYVQSIIMMSEVVSAKYRPVSNGAVWCVGSLSLCLLGTQAYYIRDWKLLTIVSTLPYTLVMVSFKFIPESIHWLHVHGKSKELMEVLKRIAYWNKKDIPESITILPSVCATKLYHSTPLDLFRTRKMARQSILQGYIWFVNSLVYYGLFLAADDLGGSMYFNFILMALIEVIPNFAGIYSSQRFGRRKAVWVSMLLGGVACTTVMFIPSFGMARVIFGLAGKLFITLSHEVIYTWSAEIYPVKIRAEGMGFLQIASKLGAASSPWLVKELKMISPSTPFMLMGLLLIVGVFFSMFLQETKGRATLGILEDVSSECSSSEEKATRMVQDTASICRRIRRDVKVKDIRSSSVTDKLLIIWKE